MTSGILSPRVTVIEIFLKSRASGRGDKARSAAAIIGIMARGSDVRENQKVLVWREPQKRGITHESRHDAMLSRGRRRIQYIKHPAST